MFATLQLRRVARLRYGDALPDAERRDGDVPVVASGGIVGRHDQPNTAAPCIIVGRKGSFGSLSYSDAPVFVIDTAFAVDRYTRPTAPRWLYYVLLQANLRSLSQDVGVPGLSRELVHELRVPDCPVDRQVAIADFLDRECERIADLQQRCTEFASIANEAALARFDDLTRAFERTRLGYHYEVRLGKMLDEGKQSDGVLVPYLRNENIGWDEIDLTDVKTMRLAQSELTRYEVKPGDLLACEGRHVGKCAIWQGGGAPIYYQKALHRIRPRASWSNRYLLWCLWLGNSRGDFYADGTGSTIPHLPAEKMRAVRLPAATREQQDAIVREVDDRHSRSRALTTTAESLDVRLREYRDAIIAEAVTGQLDVAKVSETELDERLHEVAEREAA